MEHLLLKAATTAADQGMFEAVISTPTVDRDSDIVEPQAMVNALTKWATLGKLVPLAWAHTEQVVGHVDPSTVRVENGEVITKGQVDMTTDLGKETWRLVKSGTLSFSFGYLIPDGGAEPLEGGRERVKELDLFEISVVPIGPANNDTRVLAWKSHDDRAQVLAELNDVKERLEKAEQALEALSKTAEPGKEPEARPDDPLHEKARDLISQVRMAGAKPPERVAKEQPPRPDMEPDELKRRSRDLMVELLNP